MAAEDAGALRIRAEDHLPLVRMCVRRCGAYYADQEELFQQGCVGLMQAAARFDSAHGASFSSYAVPYILGEMKAYLRSCTALHISRREWSILTEIRAASEALRHSLGREPHINELAEELHMEPAELAWRMESSAACAYDDAVSAQSTHGSEASAEWTSAVMLRDIMDRLPPRDRRLLHMRYLHGMTQQEAARELGMTQVQLSRREAKLRSLLRQMWYESEKE